MNPFAASREAWQASVPFLGIANDMTHPVSLSFTRNGATWSCVVASNMQAFDGAKGLRGGLRISGVSDRTGTVCGDGNALNRWGTNDGQYPGTYLLVNEFTENATWASAPAVVPDGDGYRLYYTINLAKPNQCVIYSVLVSAEGVYTGSSEGRRMGGALCNAGPVALLNAWGKGFHAIAMMQQNGVVAVLDWRAFAPTQVSYSLQAFLPDEGGAYVFAGSYLALSPAGTLLAIVHQASSQHAWLVAVVGGFNAPPPMPTPVIPIPSAAPPAPSNAVTDTGRPVDNVVAGLFGGVSLAAALAVLFVASYPDARASKIMVAGARAVWSGGAAAANGLANKVLRGGAPPTQLMGSGATAVFVSGGERASLLRPAAPAAAAPAAAP